MQTSNIILTTLCAIGLGGCNAGTNVLVKTKLVDRPELIVPSVQPIIQSDMKWIVLTPQNYEKKIKDLESRGESVTLFALSAQGYRNLSMNVAELRKYIQQQNTVIAAYKKYYTAEQKPKEEKKK